MRSISTFQCAADIADLYRRYLEYIAHSREEIESRTVPGSFRERLLANYRPLALEHFEARLDSLRAQPSEYAAAVESLQRGFMPAE